MLSLLFHRWTLLAIIVLAALWLRVDALAERPMHADEANQAVKLGDLLETGRYAFDPRDHHGPTLYYAAVPVAWLRGESTLTALTETTVRLVPAIAGTLSVALLALLLWPPAPAASPSTDGGAHAALTSRFTAGPALAAAAFLSVSPPAVYYSRYFIQETLLVTFTLGTFVCAQRWWRDPHVLWAVSAGVCVGLMQATKATAPLFLGAAALAFATVRTRGWPAPTNRLLRDLAIALVSALVVAAAFYSSFGTHWSGLRDAVATYTAASDRAASGAGHEKPWWYYLQLLGWQRSGGLLWHQIAFTALALCGAALAFIPPPHRKATCQPIVDLSLLRGAALYTALVALLLSAIPYKTPWHVIHLIPGLAVLAVGVLAALVASAAASSYAPVAGATDKGIENARRFRQFTSQLVAGVLLLAVLQTLYTQTKLVAFLRPADARNPYAYVHSSPDVLKVRPLAEAALARTPRGVVRVIAEEYWPLPWYLRGLPNVGYWNSPPAEVDSALIIASETAAESVRERLKGTYRESLLGLRPGVLCVVFTPEP